MSRKKDKNKRFQELNRHSDKNLHNLREENGVIYASEVFKAKKKLDKWWKDALKRVNNIKKGEKDDKWEFM